MTGEVGEETKGTTVVETAGGGIYDRLAAWGDGGRPAASSRGWVDRSIERSSASDLAFSFRCCAAALLAVSRRTSAAFIGDAYDQKCASLMA